MSSNLMKGVIDMHVHSNPDLRLRAYDDFELMEAGDVYKRQGYKLRDMKRSCAAVFGTLERPVHAMNLEEYARIIKKDVYKRQVLFRRGDGG